MSTEMKKIQENWTALYEAEALTAEKTGDPDARFHADLFFFQTGGRSIILPVLYRKKTRTGFTKKYFKMNVIALFCPLTGKPLYSDSLASLKKKYG